MRTLFVFLACELFISGIAGAEAPTPSCEVTADIQACSDGSGSRTEVNAAIKEFKKICTGSQAHFTAVTKLSSQCEKIGKPDQVSSCADQWDKENRAIVSFVGRSAKEKANMEKTFWTILGPQNCAAAEQNKATLHDLTQRYDAILETLKSPRESSRAKMDLFQAAFTKALLGQKFSEPVPPRHYIGAKGEEPKAPPAAANVTSMGSVQLVTAYRLALEFNYPGPKDTTIMVAGNPVKVTAGFAKVLKLEGAGVLDDGRMVNVSGSSYMFVRIIDAPYGLGSYKRTPLEPFRSIAVDPKVIPLGSTVYIYEARGMALPPGADGTPVFHDGYFRAIDIGSMINGTHIDVYSGHLLEDYRFLQNYFDGKTVHFYVVK
ncbi:MAG: 3D domain-containing protein [Bdellovibrionota bacterium]